MPNRLATETSPYLRQHADNPVGWYPWGPDAFREAKDSDRPILLSIGYAACHWCHVMAHESFEDPATAEVMNRLFVNVKVDREERPDVDGIYMQAVQAMTGRGGWPMTVFLTPDGEPFYGGTYFPPHDTQGIPSFTRLMEGVANAWTTRREAVIATTATLRDLYRNAGAALTPSGTVNDTLLRDAARGILRLHDPIAQGFGAAPKFPQAMTLDFLLRHGTRQSSEPALSAVTETWLAMADGGIHDQLGGGFARYATDRNWVVPHFEKMLYDNALLARLGVHLVQTTGSAEVERTTRAIFDWVRREMTGDEGGLYSSIDADSEGEEGRFYVWTRDELRALLGDDAPLAEMAFGVTAQGNFEGHSILVRAMPDSFLAAKLEMAPADVATRMASIRATLLAARAQRVRPATDRKRVAAWNGLMLCAMADAARLFDDAALLQSAERLAHFLTTTMCVGDRIGRSWIEGGRVTPGFLEDQAAVAAGMLALYMATGSTSALEHARALAAAMVRDFHDPAAGSFYDTARDHEALITRPRELTDNATPSGAALACDVLLQLAVLDDVAEYRAIVARHLDAVAAMMVEHPLGFGHWLGVTDRWVHGSVEVAVAGEGTEALLAALRRTYVPTLVLARGAPSPGAPALLQGREPIDGRATAWVCRGFACELPATDATTFAQQLRAAVRFTNT